jgi:hypothetical protein
MDPLQTLEKNHHESSTTKTKYARTRYSTLEAKLPGKELTTSRAAPDELDLRQNAVENFPLAAD